MHRRTTREGRLKANPLCALVLVAIGTFITWHLGERNKGEKEREEVLGQMKRGMDREDRAKRGSKYPVERIKKEKRCERKNKGV